MRPNAAGVAAFIVAAVASSTTASAQPVDPRWSTFRIAYVETSPNRVCVMEASNLARACVIAEEAGTENRDISWSPDGTMIASHQELFVNADNIGRRIVVVASDGSECCRVVLLRRW